MLLNMLEGLCERQEVVLKSHNTLPPLLYLIGYLRFTPMFGLHYN